MVENDGEELKNVSLILMKISVFLKDMIVFRLRSRDEVEKDLQGKYNKRGTFTITEISTYERIVNYLKVDSNSIVIKTLEQAI